MLHCTKYLKFLFRYLTLVIVFFQLEVLVPPTVQAMPRVGKVTVRKGKDFTLRCAAKGNPNPTITWSKEVSLKNLLN